MLLPSSRVKWGLQTFFTAIMLKNTLRGAPERERQTFKPITSAGLQIQTFPSSCNQPYRIQNPITPEPTFCSLEVIITVFFNSGVLAELEEHQDESLQMNKVLNNAMLISLLNSNNLKEICISAEAHGNPGIFVELHCEALEFDIPIANIHHWIDLSNHALDAINIFQDILYKGTVSFGLFSHWIQISIELGRDFICIVDEGERRSVLGAMCFPEPAKLPPSISILGSR
ncbi:uncharacterized protein VP01_22g3 [Puccinia sorghi]|uniref:BEACH domain-containing protein n=1 Tax=Puccinia sorghi TaxID=27349 RepID=A0A0L6V835_9BASI|nr:uncharacterized protein VP01_22g3 [Puccinia sorghi]